MNAPSILGFDVGGTKTGVLIGTTQGEIRARRSFFTRPERGFQPVFDQIVETADEVLKEARSAVLAISVSIGGPLDVLNGIIKSPPNLPGWQDIPLKQLLERRFQLPVYVEHDGNAGALSEFFFGAGRGFKNIIFITMGTGFGAGLILDGRLYRGTSDVAGEAGHIRVAEDGPLCYGKAGSLEGYGSGTGIARLAQMMYPKRWGPETTARELHDAWHAGSPEARAVFARAALYLGRGLAILADILNPQRIILGGLGMRAQEALIKPAMRVFAEEALSEAQRVCEIVPAQLGESIGDIAAICAALDQGQLFHLHQAEQSQS
jgi:glucokinase